MRSESNGRPVARRTRGAVITAGVLALLLGAVVVQRVGGPGAVDALSGASVPTGLLTNSVPAEGHVVPAPELDESPSDATVEVAVLAGGCFWGVQGVFEHVDGVVSAVSGYAGRRGRHGAIRDGEQLAIPAMRSRWPSRSTPAR